MNRTINLPSLDSHISYITLPGTGECGKDICDGVGDKIANRIKMLQKDGLLEKPWYKFW